VKKIKNIKSSRIKAILFI